MILRKDRTMRQTALYLVRKHGEKLDPIMFLKCKSILISIGFLSLYDGLSAQLLRQLTYTTVRFHLYSAGKQYIDEFNFFHKIFVATVSGLLAGVIGIPTEMINTRLQVDRELNPKYRRNYKHVFDGLYKVVRYEGFRALYTGGLYACSRAALITIGQNAMYDQVGI